MIRPATADDVEGVLALWVAERSPHAVTEDTSAAVLRALDALLVAEEGGEIVGAVIAGSDASSSASAA